MRQRDEAEGAVVGLAAISARVRGLSSAPTIQQTAEDIDHARRVLSEYLRVTGADAAAQAAASPGVLRGIGLAVAAPLARWVYGNGVAVRLEDVAAILSDLEHGFIEFRGKDGALLAAIPFVDSVKQAAALDSIYLAAGIGPAAITKG